MRMSALGFLRNGVLALVLFASSAWMIATVPPLWRDVDAYNQLTRSPLLATYWGHAPAYCCAAKIPLFLGEQWERWRGMPAPKTEIGSTPLTDSGVGLLILAQHLALFGAAFYFVIALSSNPWIRFVLALAWASNALFYTFAHCVGSETLSVILVILLVGKGLRLIRSRNEPRWIDWYIFAVLLWLCLLSRHINSWLIVLLPLAFLFSAAQNFAASGAEPRNSWRWLTARNFRPAVTALAIGLACLTVANFATQALARKTKFHIHSRIGYTFLWRLHFLKPLSPPARNALLQRVSARTHSLEARQLMTLLGQMHAEGVDPEAGPITLRAIPLLFPNETVVPWEKLDLALNQMAYAFLLPPTPEHLQATRTDFVSALNMPVASISSFLIETTAYYFANKDEMPACAELVTFRGASAESIRQIPIQHGYFQLWKGLSYGKALVVWLASLLALLVVARWRNASVAPMIAFGIALTAVGLPMVASACLLTDFLPRYGLPMWQLLLPSLFIFVGETADLCVMARTSRGSRTIESGATRDSKQSAGQRPKKLG
jgi:hypothetical protein